MAAPTPRQVCEFGEFAHPRGCRRRATTAVGYSFLMGYALGGKGQESMYSQRITYRCDNHLDVENAIGTMPIEDARRAYATEEKV